MAHFAEIDENNIVVRVLVVSDEDALDGQNFLANILGLGGTWIQTSYNTHNGIHYGPDGKPDGGKAIGFNYAGLGSLYDSKNNAFYLPSPHPSWVLDKTAYTWNPPVPAPIDGKSYIWNEEKTNWDEVNVEAPPNVI